MKLSYNLPGYEDLEIEISDDGFIKSYCLQGSIKTLELFHLLKKKYGAQINQWPNLIEDRSKLDEYSPQERRSLLLLQELILQAQGKPRVPYTGEIVCDCRQVSAETIDKALLANASSVEEISTWTTACTACTSCKGKIEEIIEYRLPKKSA